MTDKVRFIKCTKDQYENLSNKDDNALYFCTDTSEIFLGGSLAADATPTEGIVNYIDQQIQTVPQWEEVKAEVTLIADSSIGNSKLVRVTINGEQVIPGSSRKLKVDQGYTLVVISRGSGTIQISDANPMNHQVISGSNTSSFIISEVKGHYPTQVTLRFIESS